MQSNEVILNNCAVYGDSLQRNTITPQIYGSHNEFADGIQPTFVRFSGTSLLLCNPVNVTFLIDSRTTLTPPRNTLTQYRPAPHTPQMTHHQHHYGIYGDY